MIGLYFALCDFSLSVEGPDVLVYIYIVHFMISSFHYDGVTSGCWLVTVTVSFTGGNSVRLNACCASSTASLFAVVAIFCECHETD